MARSSTKNNKNISNSGEAVVLKKWNDMLAQIDNYTADNIDGLLKFIKQTISDNIYLKAMNDSRLSVYDENFYECYARLMGCYNAVVGIYNNNPLPFSDAKIKEIYDGLNDIIALRAKIFEEKNGKYDFDAECTLNPILEEKNDIVFECLKFFSKEFDDIQYKFKITKQKEIIFSLRQKYFNVIEESEKGFVVDKICEEIKKNCGLYFYKLYATTVKNTVANLNDLEKRSVVSYYFETLNQEHEILSNIIKVQAGALENYIKNGNEEKLTIAVINGVLNLLREVYQHFSKEIAEILLSHKAKMQQKDEKSAPKNDSLEMFEEKVFSLINKDTLTTEFDFKSLLEETHKKNEDIRTLVFKETTKMIEEILRKKNTVEDYYKIKKLFSKTEIMADDMRAAFKYIHNYYKENYEKMLNDTENIEIIKGVAETIEIKIESIEENKQMFKAESEKYLTSSSANKIDIAIDEAKIMSENCYDNIMKSLIRIDKDSRKGSALIKNEFKKLHESDPILEYNEKLSKIKKQKIEDADKKTIRFIKDNLLFEMMTFEEVITYSVSRLRETQNLDVMEFINVIDAQSTAIETILKQNDIELIYPKSHDIFNGKEHEVLLAEKNDEYKKGEIIKVMNGGYRYGEIVILRANVIAAK